MCCTNSKGSISLELALSMSLLLFVLLCVGLASIYQGYKSSIETNLNFIDKQLGSYWEIPESVKSCEDIQLALLDYLQKLTASQPEKFPSWLLIKVSSIEADQSREQLRFATSAEANTSSFVQSLLLTGQTLPQSKTITLSDGRYSALCRK